MAKEYSWNLTGNNSELDPASALPEDIKVERFALSYILAPYKNYPTRSITVVNLHPDSWNSMMLPYGGLRLEEPNAAASARSFNDLSACLHGLITDKLEAYLEGAARELSAYYSDIPDLHDLPPFFRNYSLKFSKSANQWTAYIFTYHAAPASLLTAGDLPRAEIQLNPLDVHAVLTAAHVGEYVVEENVLALLKSQIVHLWTASAA